MKKLLLLAALATMSLFSLPAAVADAKHDNWIEVLTMSATATRSTEFKNTDPAKLRKLPNAKQHKRAISTISKARTLVTKINRSKDASPKQVKQFGKQIKTLDRQLSSFTSGFPAAEGPASCMMDCDSAYPGIGHGAGINRVLCKAQCIAISIGGNNPD